MADPAARMNMREQHIVPLSRQALAILRELEPAPAGFNWCSPACAVAYGRSATTP